MYTNAYFGSLMVGPIIAGAMTDAVGWRSFWWLNVAMYGFVLLFVLLLHPETYYDRRQLVVSDTRSQSFDSERTYVPEKAEPGSEENAEPGSVEEAEISVTIDQAHNHVDKYLRKGRPILSQLIKITMCGTTKQILHSLITPHQTLLLPNCAVDCLCLLMGTSALLLYPAVQSTNGHD